MGLDHCIGNGTAPFDGADREDGQAAGARYVTQISGEVSLPLSAKAGNAVKWDTGQNSLVQGNVPEKFQPIKQAVHVGRILAHLELAQPDKAGNRTARILNQKSVKPGAAGIVYAVSNSSLDLPFCDNQGIRAKPFDDCDPGQDGLRRPALFHETSCQILVRSGCFGRTLQPGLEIARPSTREHLEAVEFAQGCQVFAAGFLASRIIDQIIRPQPKLRGQKARDRQGNNLAGRQ